MKALPSAISISIAILAGCESDDPVLPPVQIEGEILSYYAANEEVCEGTVEYGERWMLAVAARLGISADEIIPTKYYWLDSEDVHTICGPDTGGCARNVKDGIRIFAAEPLSKHELVHAVQLSAWPRGRRVLSEGLATLYADDQISLFWGFDPDGLDIDAQLEIAHTELDTYFAGLWIMSGIVERYGTDALRDFWSADTRDGSAEEFRALFEQHFGESLDKVLAEVSPDDACAVRTCVEDVVEWQGDVWITESPTGCGDGLTWGTSSELSRSVLLEVPEAGNYTVSVSQSDRAQMVVIDSCTGPCPIPGQGHFFAGTGPTAFWEPGLYRVTTFKMDAADPGVRVEIRSL